MEAEDGSFIIVYLGDGESKHQLELTWLRDHPQPYNLGENEFHLALEADDFAMAYALHKALGCIVFEIRQWASTSSPTRPTTGSRSCLQNHGQD